MGGIFGDHTPRQIPISWNAGSNALQIRTFWYAKNLQQSHPPLGGSVRTQTENAPPVGSFSFFLSAKAVF
jgi:hypothetical protein